MSHIVISKVWRIWDDCIINCFRISKDIQMCYLFANLLLLYSVLPTELEQEKC
jgi:hypothetical protein